MSNDAQQRGNIVLKHGSISLCRWYIDAYRVATMVVIIGTILKIVGFLASVLPLYDGYRLFIEGRSPNVILSIGLAVVIIFGFFLVGVFVTAVGHFFRSTLDTAVHTSPFLDDQEKAFAMGV